MDPEKKASDKYPLLPIMAVFLFYLSSIVSAGTVVVRPGQFDHFTLQMPDKAVAGENFVVKVTAYDSNKNLITNFSETGKEFRVDVSGQAITQPSVLTAASFAGGVANIVVNDKKAERLILAIREAGGSVPVITRDILVEPNKLDHFAVQAPATVTAGYMFDVKIVAKDIFGNTVQALDIGKNIKVTSSGTSSVRMRDSAMDFRNGLASAAFISEKAGDVVIHLQDTSSGSRGATDTIGVNPAGLAYFKMQAPKTGIAGEPFELFITAHDMYDNVVTTYSSTGGGVKLSTTGSSKIEPSTVNSSAFVNGQAHVKAVYEKAEELQVVARELNREQSGKTDAVMITNASADHFSVVTPDSAVSGRRFQVRVEAYDRFNNAVRNFNISGLDVMLTSSGSGNLNPDRIAPTDFVNGIAVVDLMYDRAESFQISARMSGDRSSGRISLLDKTARQDVSTAPDRSRTRDISSFAEKETARKPASESIDKTKQTAARQAPVQETKKDKPEKKAAVTAEPRKEATKTPVRETEKKQADPQPVVARLEAPKSVPVEKKTEKLIADEQKKPPVEPARKEEKKTEKLLYNVSRVSVIEAKNKAMLVINITNPNGSLEYRDEIESKYGKEWLKLRINPAVNSTEKSFRFTSAYIGEMLIEEDKTGGQNQVNMFIELLPSGITYDIARIKNTLVVTFSNP